MYTYVIFLDIIYTYRHIHIIPISTVARALYYFLGAII